MLPERDWLFWRRLKISTISFSPQMLISRELCKIDLHSPHLNCGEWTEHAWLAKTGNVDSKLSNILAHTCRRNVKTKTKTKKQEPNTDLVGVLSSVVVVASVCCSPVSAQFCEYGRWGRKYWSFAGPHAWTVPFHCDQHGWTCAGPCCKRLLRRNSPQWNNSTLLLSQNKNTNSALRFVLVCVYV